MMDAVARSYVHAADYEKVAQFLVRTYSTAPGHVNWLQPRWEYMHHTSGVAKIDLAAIGIWEAGGEIVGVIHPEHQMGTAYVEIDPDSAHLKPEMLAYGQEHLGIRSDGVGCLEVYINDGDEEFQRAAAEMGYSKDGTSTEPMSHFVIPAPFPRISLPAGFRLKSLADGNDPAKVYRAIWRGFDHPGPPPESGIERRKLMESAPGFREDLHIVVEAPDGSFVSYCGLWYEPVHRIAYVEPVATDPDYRRMGLASAAILEGIRRCAGQGATVAYVGSATPFYQSVGFRQIYNRSAWRREWP